MRFQAIWRGLHPGPAGADEIDERLHAERLEAGAQRHHEAELDGLPDGTFVLHRGVARLVLGDRLLAWTPAGYVEPDPRGERVRAVVVTPPSLVDVLRAGWDPVVPLLHPTADVR